MSAVTSSQAWFTIIYLAAVAFIVFVYPWLYELRARKGGPGW